MRAPARRHVPASSPSTMSPPGQTVPGGNSSRRLAASGTRSSRSPAIRYGSPLGRIRAGAGVAGADAASRNAGSSAARIHASPSGVRTGTSSEPNRLEQRSPGARGDPCPPGERRRVRWPGDVEPAPRELPPRVERLHLGRRHRPDGRLPCAVPADEDAAGRTRIAQPVRVLAHRVPCPRVRPDLAVQQLLEPIREAHRLASPALVVGERPQREHRHIAPRDDEHAEPRTPQLGERGMLPVVGPDPRHPGVQREEGGTRDGVLQPGPRRPPERRGRARQPRVERTDVPPEGEDRRRSRSIGSESGAPLPMAHTVRRDAGQDASWTRSGRRQAVRGGRVWSAGVRPGPSAVPRWSPRAPPRCRVAPRQSALVPTSRCGRRCAGGIPDGACTPSLRAPCPATSERPRVRGAAPA